MATIITETRELETLADLLDELGDIDPRRIRWRPYPGTATEDDVVAIEEHEDRLFELVDGVLVEKVMGLRESLLAGAILAALRAFVVPRKIGFVTGSDGMMRLFPGLVRMPDVAFTSWERTPEGRVPTTAMLDGAPDLAVEVLSPSNRPKEMSRKLAQYFDSGVRRVWFVDERTRSLTDFSSEVESTTYRDDAVVAGGELLPGFELPLRELFAELDLQGPEGQTIPNV